MKKKTSTDTVRTGAAYIRESTKDQDKGYSPDNQKRQIEEYAKRNNIKIVAWYKDLISGTSTTKREAFAEMMHEAEKKRFDIILVYHTSRFARNIEDSRKYKERLRTKLDTDVVSVTQHFGDWENPNAFLNEGINELFDAYYSKQLSKWLRDAFAEKRLQGYQIGNPPLGYYKKQVGYDEERERPMYERKWRVDKREATIVNQVFELYTTGKYSYADIAAKLNARGLKTKYGNPFTFSSVKDILKNKVYIGYVYSPKKKLPEYKHGKHEAIVDEELFWKAQKMIEARRNTKGRPVAQHRFYLLQDLLYCYKCRKHMEGKGDKPYARLLPKMYCATQIANAKKRKEVYKYGCKFRRENKSCTQALVECHIIDKQVLKLMEGIKLPDEIQRMVLEKLEALFDSATATQEKMTPTKIEEEVQKIEKRKHKLNVIYRTDEDYPDEQYRAEMAALNEELEKIQGYATITPSSPKVGKKEAIKKTSTFLNDFKIFWKSGLPPVEQRAWILMTIKRVWVKDKKVVAVEPHDEFRDLFHVTKKVLFQAPLATPLGIFCLNELLSAQ